jgi:RimJ/RimL family protein N-acetyltransferase
MSDTYFLRTQRLGFRIWTEKDVDLAITLWGDSDVTRLIGGPFSEEQVRQRLEQEISTMKAHGVQYWPIFLLTGGDFVGCCGLRPHKPDERVYEIGVHLRSACQRHGFACEATTAVMNHAFNTLGAAGLFAGHNPVNEPSRHLLRKLGFRYTHDEYYPPTGLNHPSYPLTVGEFLRSYD